MQMDGQERKQQRRGRARHERRRWRRLRHRRARHRHRQRRRRAGRRLDLRHQPARPARHDERRRRRAGGRAAAGAGARRRRRTTPAPSSFPRCCAAPRSSGPTSSARPARPISAPKLVLFKDEWHTGCGNGRRGDGAVLLPERPEGLHRPQLLRHAGAVASARPASSPRPTSIAHEVGHHVQNQMGIMRQVDAHARARRRSAGQRASASGSSCRPTASPASGRAARSRRRAGASSRATSRRRSTPPRRSATTSCSARRAAGGAGELHPRHERAAGELVQARRRERQRRCLQHLRGSGSIGSALRHDGGVKPRRPAADTPRSCCRRTRSKPARAFCPPRRRMARRPCRPRRC